MSSAAEKQIEEVWKAAAADAAANRDQQVLTGELAALQAEYDDAYTEQLAELKDFCPECGEFEVRADKCGACESVICSDCGISAATLETSRGLRCCECAKAHDVPN